MYAGQLLINSIPRAGGWGLAVVAVSVALLVLRLHQRASRVGADGLQAALGILLGLPLALNPHNWKQFTPTWQMIILWLVSCLCVVLAVLRLQPRPIKLDLRLDQPFTWVDRLAIALFFVGALALRVPAIETLPLGVDPDEASLAMAAYEAASAQATDPFATGWATHPTLQFFINGLFVHWLGRTFLAMRLPWAIAGSIAVVMVYLLARVGYGRRVAILAGVLAMGSNVAVHFSRLGINNMSDMLFMTWTLAALWAAGGSGKPGLYALAGVGLGFGQYFYFGNRAIPFVVIATLLVWLIADWRGVLRAWRLILATALVSLVIALPLIGHWLRHPGSISEHLTLTIPFTAHLQEQATRLNVPVMTLWWQQIRDSLLVFTFVPDRGSFYHPGQAMLHPLQVPLFLIGLLALFAAWRRPISRGILVWMAVVLLLGSVLITDAATFHRLLGVLPAGILVVAVGIDAGATVLAHSLRWTPRAATGIAVLAVAVLVAADVYFYFGVYNVRQAYKTPTQEAVSIAALEYQRARGQGAFILYTRQGVDLESGKIYHSPIAYAAGGGFRGGTPTVVEALDVTQPLYFYILPDQVAELPDLIARFPGGTIRRYHRPSDGLLVMTRYAVE
jgi:4-amino-4-deoxy-L-arabinose transferase-like glycosyltransferase